MARCEARGSVALSSSRPGRHARPLRRLLSICAGLTLLLGCASSAGAATVTPSMRLDAYSPHLGPNTPPVASRTRLNRGVLYVAAVQGTVSFYAAIDYADPQQPFTRLCGDPEPAPLFGSAGGSGEVGEDAQFIFAYPSAKPCGGPRLPHVWSNFQANLGAGWQHPLLDAADPLTHPTSDHLYDYGFVGRGQPVRFRLVDSDTRDDYGTLEISLRRATAADCAGSGYLSFGLSSRSVCESMASGPEPAPPPRVHRLTLDQSPLQRVLRNRDVPTATNQQVPSGVLDAQQFAGLDTTAHSAAHALAADGFVSGAISEYRGGGLPDLTSTAIRYRNDSSARAGLASELRLARLQVPTGATVSVAGVPVPAGAEVVTFTPGAPAGPGGDELLVRAGAFVYGLTAIEAPDRVSVATETALLDRAVARTPVAGSSTGPGAG